MSLWLQPKKDDSWKPDSFDEVIEELLRSSTIEMLEA